MIPFKKILCPTDFSEPSYVALKEAVELAKHFSADLVVVHVVTKLPCLATSPVDGVDIALFQEELEKARTNRLRVVVNQNVPDGLRACPVVVSGPAADQIVHVAIQKKADLIVIATHGETGWRHFLFGSVAEKVVRTATCPVLTIHAPEEETAEKKEAKPKNMKAIIEFNKEYGVSR